VADVINRTFHGRCDHGCYRLERSPYEHYVHKGAQVAAGKAYFDVHAADIEEAAAAADSDLLYIHSAVLGSTVDGPGLRLTVFPLARCAASIATTGHLVQAHRQPMSLGDGTRRGQARASAQGEQGRHHATGGEPMVQPSSRRACSGTASRLACTPPDTRAAKSRFSDEQLMDTT
jgi:hypothetical protein